jgi:hypothetical protein
MRPEWSDALRTASVTLLGGVILFTLNQWVQKLFFDPWTEQRKVIGEIDCALTFWARAYANPAPVDQNLTAERLEASAALRRCASRLLATTNAMRWYALAVGAPKQPAVREAARCLILLSNSMSGGTGRENRADATRVRGLLGLTLDAHGEGGNNDGR